MKKIILIILASCNAFNMVAQVQDSTFKSKKKYTHDRDLSRWVIDFNLLGGAYFQNYTSSGSALGYSNEITSVSNNGTLKFYGGSSLGGDAQIGFFFGKNRHWGLGAGFMYLYQQGNVKLDNFSVQYQSTDNNGIVFRQIITGDQVKEQIRSNNMDIPLLLKYKNRLSKRWGFTVDAGALFNLQMKNNYKSSSSFDYEGIYAYNGSTPYFDASPTPAATDFVITKSEFLSHNPNGNMQSYFNTLESDGYNVGLNESPGKKTGSVSYNTVSVGLLLQPSVNYFLSDNVALNFGLHYLFQPFKNNAQSDYMLTNKVGQYSSVLNNVTNDKTQSLGLNIGVRFFLGKGTPPPVISKIDAFAPTFCGNCDGVLTLHGLKPGKVVEINYALNGVSQPAYKGEVDANGDVAVGNLCAGSYTDISAKIGRRTAQGYPIKIVSPVLVVSSENGSNPSANGRCDGAITFDGLYMDKPVTISYAFNGILQSPYNGIVAADNTVKLTGLCEGAYTGFVVNINTCVANGKDISLIAPPPPVPPSQVPSPAADSVPSHQDKFGPILFNSDKTTVHDSSMPLIKAAAAEMKKDQGTVAVVNGYADAIGSKAINKRLSDKRALSVKDRLKKLGINPKRVKILGHGSKDPVGDNNTHDGRQQNRRAIIELKNK